MLLRFIVAVMVALSVASVHVEAGPIRRVAGAVRCGAASVAAKIKDARPVQTVKESKPVQADATVVKLPATFIRGGASACLGGVCEK